jgi:hypothetical protein
MVLWDNFFVPYSGAFIAPSSDTKPEDFGDIFIHEFVDTGALICSSWCGLSDKTSLFAESLFCGLRANFFFIA